jgi:hypothetical protein
MEGRSIYCRTRIGLVTDHQVFFKEDKYHCNCDKLAHKFYVAIRVDNSFKDYGKYILVAECKKCKEGKNYLTEEELDLVTKHNYIQRLYKELEFYTQEYIKECGEEHFRKATEMIIKEYYIKDIIE